MHEIFTTCANCQAVSDANLLLSKHGLNLTFRYGDGDSVYLKLQGSNDLKKLKKLLALVRSQAKTSAWALEALTELGL